MKHESEDWARLAVDYHDDPKLYVVADAMESEHGRKHRYLVKLYWPRIVAEAKSAKTFGWFRTTPKKLADSLDDVTSENVRLRLLALMESHGLIVTRAHAPEVGDRALMDVRPAQFASWQSMSASERKRLERARRLAEAGDEVSWTLAHLLDGSTASGREGGTHVYFILDDSTGLVKIGASKNPWSRARELQVGSAGEVSLVAVEKNVDRGYEGELRARYESLRVRGEWFTLGGPLLAHLQGLSHDERLRKRYVTTLDETRLDETRLEKVKGSLSQPKAATSRVGSMTNDEVDAEIASCRETLGEQASAIVCSLVDVMASENTTGTVAASRALRILWRPTAALVSSHSPAALLHGLQAAAAKGAPNHNYVAKAASGYQSAPKLLTRHQPRLSATTDDEYDAIFGGQATATSDGSAA